MWGLLALAATGCAIPDYHIPHGFSSSYYRHLQRGQTGTITAAPTPWTPYQPNAAGMPRTYQSLDMSPPQIGPAR
ncbi:MAG: hypothetical protein SH850_26185 [Planctomycetaceae bacterium]|nr:hypothetical protein [Planctomycetaceae bacterium]